MKYETAFKTVALDPETVMLSRDGQWRMVSKDDRVILESTWCTSECPLAGQDLGKVLKQDRRDVTPSSGSPDE